MLYYCKECGRWQDVRILQHLSTIVDNFAKAMNTPTPERPAGYACPDGHGLMTLIQPADRIMLRPVDPDGFPISEESEAHHG